MSNKVQRLHEIARAIAEGNRDELTMRIPAEPDRDADLVVSWAATEIERLQTVCNDQDAQANRNAAEVRRLCVRIAEQNADNERLRGENLALTNEVEVLRFAGDVQGERLTAAIEQVEMLLREARQRTQNLLHRQHGDAIIMNPDEYLRATLSWLDDALAESGHESGQNGPSAADQPAAAPHRCSITLNGHAIHHLWDALGGEYETELTVETRGPFVDPEEGPMPAGLYAYYTEYPEEGYIGPLCDPWPGRTAGTADNAAAQPAAANCPDELCKRSGRCRHPDHCATDNSALSK